MNWKLYIQYGSTFIYLYDNDNKVIDTYKEYNETFKRDMPKSFSFLEREKGIPQNICNKLNEELNPN